MLLPSLPCCGQERHCSSLCSSAEPCLTTTGPGTVACPARGSASPMGTSCTSSMPPTMSGGKPGLSRRTARASRSGSSPARKGECPSAGAVTRGASWRSPASVSPAALMDLLRVGSPCGPSPPALPWLCSMKGTPVASCSCVQVSLGKCSPKLGETTGEEGTTQPPLWSP